MAEARRRTTTNNKEAIIILARRSIRQLTASYNKQVNKTQAANDRQAKKALARTSEKYLIIINHIKCCANI
jgi:hypothetical protein